MLCEDRCVRVVMNGGASKCKVWEEANRLSKVSCFVLFALQMPSHSCCLFLLTELQRLPSRSGMTFTSTNLSLGGESFAGLRWQIWCFSSSGVERWSCSSQSSFSLVFGRLWEDAAAGVWRSQRGLVSRPAFAAVFLVSLLFPHAENPDEESEFKKRISVMLRVAAEVITYIAGLKLT